MGTENFKEQFDYWRKAVEEEMQRLVPSALEAPVSLHAAMRHSLEAGGKRLRPVLVCSVAETFSEHSSPLPAAVAVECLHTYTLIHDDLPAMDNSDLRRGQPTCHKAFGEAAAILAGDALLTLAFEILATSYADKPDLCVSLISELAKASGSLKLVGGQMDDIENENKLIDAATLRSINQKKTGALISASCVLGALIGGASKADVEIIRDFGGYMGEAFQLVDDILDHSGSEEETGKSAGLDEANNKATLVSLEGLEQAKSKVIQLTNTAKGVLQDSKGDTVFLESLVDWLANRTT